MQINLKIPISALPLGLTLATCQSVPPAEARRTSCSTRVSGESGQVRAGTFRKQTSWLNGDDTFLTLDRDDNGQADSGRELFANAAVALGRWGLAGMAWVDVDYDGKLTSVNDCQLKMSA